MIYWSIPQLERKSVDGGVVEVHWCATIVEDPWASSVYGTKMLSPEPSSESFVPFESLTEELVLQWCHTDTQKAAIEEELQVRLTKLKNGEILTNSLPWS